MSGSSSIGREHRRIYERLVIEPARWGERLVWLPPRVHRVRHPIFKQYPTFISENVGLMAAVENSHPHTLIVFGAT